MAPDWPFMAPYWPVRRYISANMVPYWIDMAPYWANMAPDSIFMAGGSARFQKTQGAISAQYGAILVQYGAVSVAKRQHDNRYGALFPILRLIGQYGALLGPYGAILLPNMAPYWQKIWRHIGQYGAVKSESGAIFGVLLWLKRSPRLVFKKDEALRFHYKLMPFHGIANNGNLLVLTSS